MINLIAAIDLNGGLGFNNQLLTKLPNDMKYFKELTTGHFVVMGNNTFKSIGKHLPNRHNIVLTRNTEHELPPDVYVYDSVEQILFEYKNYANEEVDLWIIGGESIYTQFLPHADRIHLTIIDHAFEEVDSFFPKINLRYWKPVQNIKHEKDHQHPYDYYFVTYEKRFNEK